MVLTQFNFTWTTFVQALYFIRLKANKALELGISYFTHSPIQQYIPTEQPLCTGHCCGCWPSTDKTGEVPALYSLHALGQSYEDIVLARTRQGQWLGVGRDRTGRNSNRTKVPCSWHGRQERMTRGRVRGTEESHHTGPWRTLGFFFFCINYKLLKAFQESQIIWCLSYKVHFEWWVGLRLCNS